ncbi:hypothetical protein CHARACLAT_000586 [Characodon lateralis]|uniref:Uncharacterized protein n=1 Tax=Characodon lateralis TaxID=208331 RepID=A0ABU7EF89_9TELE|nr:hypothetical protein [Characodon lateralis]
MCFPKTPLGFQEKHVQKETGWKSRGESREEGFKSQPGITKQQRAWGAARTPTPTPHCPDTASIPQPPLPSAQTGGEKKRPRGAAEQPIQVELRRGCSCSIQAEQDRLCAGEAGRKGSVGRAGTFLSFFSPCSCSFSPGSHQQRPGPCDLEETTPTERDSLPQSKSATSHNNDNKPR